MSRAIDIAGQAFGDLTVIERVESEPGRTGARWLCVCSCGTEITARGTDLRKGYRRSCGCQSPNRRTETTTAQEGSTVTNTSIERSGIWLIVDSDGLVWMLSGLWSDALVIVELESDPAAWSCSECGSVPLWKATNGGVVTCEHVTKVTRSMSMATALEIAAIVCKPAVRKACKPAVEVDEAREARLAKGAEKRAERAAAHDRERLPVDGAVTTRRMTDEDRARLASRRRTRRPSE